jgi:hypothetical protein
MNVSGAVSRFFNQRLSTILTIILAALALGAGWLLKSLVVNQTQHYERVGVSAEIPAKWLVNNGLDGEELIFTANPPLDFNLNYQVRLLPVAAGGKITDLVVARNLSQGQLLPYYNVITQQAVRLGDRSAYQVTYTYIKQGAQGETPVIIAGRDIYFDGSPIILVATLENTDAHIDEALPGFNHFLESVRFQKEAGQ